MELDPRGASGQIERPDVGVSAARDQQAIASAVHDGSGAVPADGSGAGRCHARPGCRVAEREPPDVVVDAGIAVVEAAEDQHAVARGVV